jgi:hypothetical protein
VEDNQIVIVSGETGWYVDSATNKVDRSVNWDFDIHSGKSTQVPQYLAEDILTSSAKCGNIICTQVSTIVSIRVMHKWIVTELVS